jgi:hypothetical protein
MGQEANQDSGENILRFKGGLLKTSLRLAGGITVLTSSILKKKLSSWKAQGFLM